MSSWYYLYHAEKLYYSWPTNSLGQATWARKRRQSESANGPACSRMSLNTVGYVESARRLHLLASHRCHLSRSSMNPFSGWLWTLWAHCPEAILGTDTCLWCGHCWRKRKKGRKDVCLCTKGLCTSLPCALLDNDKLGQYSRQLA